MSTDHQAAQLGLTPLALRIGSYIASASTSGFRDSVDDDALTSAFAGVPLQELRDGIAELSVDGYLATAPLVGLRLPRMRCELELFATFDPITLGTDPTADAAELANLALLEEGTIGVPAFHERTGWSLRRFNPALAIMLTKIDDRRIGKTNDGTYPTRHFSLAAEDRVELGRFVMSVTTDG